MLTVKEFTFNLYQENTFVLSDSTGACIVIDPGCYEKSEKNILKSYIFDNKLKVEGLYNTHCHIDHILGNQFIKDTFKVKLQIPPQEEEVLRYGILIAEQLGLDAYEASIPDTFIVNENICFGNTKLDVLKVPGHSPGHLAFYSVEENICINGDVLFFNSIGRTDLPGSDHQTLINSIKKIMFTLPEETIIYCGHGPKTTIGHEKKTNPYVSLH